MDRGRTAAQLYASDCADCHRNPKAVGRTLSGGSLAGFLREHYTASKESAAALASYLSAMAPDPAPRKPASSTARPAAGKPPTSREPGKGAEGQTGAPAAKPGQATPATPAEPAAEPKTPAAEAPKPAAPVEKPPVSDAKPPPT